jgi:ABC-type phosphate/phosphonate transport system substrate-binding protein
MFKILASFVACWLALAAQAAEETMLFGVNEGTSGTMGFADRQDKYLPLAAYLGKAVKKQVRLESASNLKNLVRSLDAARYDMLLVRPSHISAAAMRDQKYSLLVSAKGDAVAYFIVHKDSPLKSRKDLKGKRIVMPDEIAYPTKIGQAMLRDEGIPLSDARLFRSQEAVGYAIENQLSDVGVVISYSKVWKDWEKKGHRTIWQSEKLPYWSIIVSPQVKPEVVSKLREALLALDTTEEGKAILEKIGIQGFVLGNQQAYLDMLAWIEKK